MEYLIINIILYIILILYIPFLVNKKLEIFKNNLIFNTTKKQKLFDEKCLLYKNLYNDCFEQLKKVKEIINHSMPSNRNIKLLDLIINDYTLGITNIYTITSNNVFIDNAIKKHINNKYIPVLQNILDDCKNKLFINSILSENEKYCCWLNYYKQNVKIIENSLFELEKKIKEILYFEEK